MLHTGPAHHVLYANMYTEMTWTDESTLADFLTCASPAMIENIG